MKFITYGVMEATILAMQKFFAKHVTLRPIVTEYRAIAHRLSINQRKSVPFAGQETDANVKDPVGAIEVQQCAPAGRKQRGG